jgi:hypothetical protein
VKVHNYLTAGGLESRLPYANQPCMFAGFALFRRLRVEWECLEVYLQATMGVDFIKGHNALPPEAFFALMDEAHKEYIPVAVHFLRV